MTRRNLRWYLFTASSFAGMAAAGLLGFFQLLHASDVTHIGLAVIGLYFVSSIWMFVKVWTGNTNYDFIYHLSELCQIGGLLGTVIGFIIALAALPQFDFGNVASSKQLVTTMALGIATALYTTAVGIVGSAMLQTQIAILEEGDAS